MTMATTAWVGLTDAAFHLGKSYNATWRLMLLGILRGRKVAGRWLVRREDVERVARKRDREPAGAAR